jgi:hypothetical protein
MAVYATNPSTVTSAYKGLRKYKIKSFLSMARNHDRKPRARHRGNENIRQRCFFAMDGQDRFIRQ